MATTYSMNRFLITGIPVPIVKYVCFALYDMGLKNAKYNEDTPSPNPEGLIDPVHHRKVILHVKFSEPQDIGYMWDDLRGRNYYKGVGVTEEYRLSDLVTPETWTGIANIMVNYNGL